MLHKYSSLVSEMIKTATSIQNIPQLSTKSYHSIQPVNYDYPIVDICTID